MVSSLLEQQRKENESRQRYCTITTARWRFRAGLCAAALLQCRSQEPGALQVKQLASLLREGEGCPCVNSQLSFGKSSSNIDNE